MVDGTKRAGMDAVASVAATALAATAQDQHGVLARVSHLAALAAERLEQVTCGAVDSSASDAGTMSSVLSMLRELQNESHLAYLKQHGAEADYQKIGAKVRSRFQTPSGKWRKPGGAE